MQSIHVFLHIKKFANFWWKIADVGRTKGVYHVIYICFRFFLGKVELCQVSSL